MLHISQPVETAPPSARAVAASTGMAAQLSTKQPETPQDQAYSQDDCMSDRLGSCSGASSSSAFQSAQKKRKVPGPATGWTKHRDDKLCSSSGPSSCGSSAASSVDCLLSWSQSYAASRGGAYIARSSFQNASAAVPGRQAPCGLLCQEEIVDEEAHPCSTSFSEMSSGSSASNSFALDGLDDASPMAVSKDDYPEDPPQALDLDKYDLPEVPPSSLSHSLASVYGFSTHVIAMGTNFLQRLAARDPWLLSSALSCPDFAPFMKGVELQRGGLLQPSIGHPTHSWQSARIYLMAVHLTCIYVAAKSVEAVPYKRLLQTMLSHVHERAVSREQAAALEMEVIQGLEWRLSPYYLTPLGRASYCRT